MAVSIQEVELTADLTVLVSRDAAGTIDDGARELIERVDRVTVRELQVTGVRPRLNDMAVEVRADLAVAVPDDDVETAARERLDDGFGLTVERIDA